MDRKQQVFNAVIKADRERTLEYLNDVKKWPMDAWGLPHPGDNSPRVLMLKRWTKGERPRLEFGRIDSRDPKTVEVVDGGEMTTIRYRTTEHVVEAGWVLD
jgi:hypothetical protein